MKSTIRIRYKHSGAILGDMASHNPYNIPGGFPGPKYPGYEEEIPATLLDDKYKTINYKNPDGTRELITEKEYRLRLHKYGGFTSHVSWHDPAPPQNPRNANETNIVVPPRRLTDEEREQFMLKQEIGLRYFKHFNPICMEIVDEIPDEIMKKARQEFPDLFQMYQGNKSEEPEKKTKKENKIDVRK